MCRRPTPFFGLGICQHRRQEYRQKEKENHDRCWKEMSKRSFIFGSGREKFNAKPFPFVDSTSDPSRIPKSCLRKFKLLRRFPGKLKNLSQFGIQQHHHLYFTVKIIRNIWAKSTILQRKMMENYEFYRCFRFFVFIRERLQHNGKRGAGKKLPEKGRTKQLSDKTVNKSERNETFPRQASFCNDIQVLDSSN